MLLCTVKHPRGYTDAAWVQCICLERMQSSICSQHQHCKGVSVVQGTCKQVEQINFPLCTQMVTPLMQTS
jgi:hypothetical protein